MWPSVVPYFHLGDYALINYDSSILIVARAIFHLHTYPVNLSVYDGLPRALLTDLN